MLLFCFFADFLASSINDLRLPVRGWKTPTIVNTADRRDIPDTVGEFIKRDWKVPTIGNNKIPTNR